MHPRELICDAVVANLTNRTSAGTRVEAFRIDTYQDSELPAIAVYTQDEQVDPNSSSTAPRKLTRNVKAEIAATVAHSEAFPAWRAMNAIAEEIEAVMDVDRFLGGTAAGSVLESTEISFPNPSADPLLGIIVLTYSVTYQTTPATGTLDDFLRAGTTTKFAGARDDNAPTDVISVRETP